MKKRTLGALLLTGVMLMGLGTSALAAGDGEVEVPDIPTINSGQTVEIRSEFLFADGLAVPEGTTFEYSVTAVTADAPEASIDAITFTDTDRTDATPDANGLYTLFKNGKINFGEWPHADTYEYTVKQTTKTMEHVTLASEEYTMYVYVINKSEDGADGCEIESVTAVKKGADDSQTGGKVTEITFVNQYEKSAKLTISKKTEGVQADKTKAFNFEIHLYHSPTNTTIQEVQGTIGNNTKPYTIGSTPTSFALKDGESLVFENIPVGMTYVVTELGAEDGYTPSYVLVQNNVAEEKREGFAENVNVSAKPKDKDKALVGEGTNSVTFTNSHDRLPITGIFINNLPFILLIVIGAAALGVLAVMKKRRMSGR